MFCASFGAAEHFLRELREEGVVEHGLRELREEGVVEHVLPRSRILHYGAGAHS